MRRQYPRAQVPVDHGEDAAVGLFEPVPSAATAASPRPAPPPPAPSAPTDTDAGPQVPDERMTPHDRMARMLGSRTWGAAPDRGTR
jgi:hypothetical protein